MTPINGLYSAKVQRAERAVEEYRNQIDTRKPEPYGFASMAAVPYAHTVANMLRNKRVKGATITLAPNPKDIVSSQHALHESPLKGAKSIPHRSG